MERFLRPPLEGSISARIYRATDLDRPETYHFVLYDAADFVQIVEHDGHAADPSAGISQGRH